MVFSRLTLGSWDISTVAVRIASTTSLLAYPAGALLRELGPDTPATSTAGYGLIVLALVACVPVLFSSIRRIVGEDVKVLDEYELRLRGRALGTAYGIFTLLALLLVVYAAFASEQGAWFPATYDQLYGVFWGVMLYHWVLPTTILSWMVEPSFARGSDD